MVSTKIFWFSPPFFRVDDMYETFLQKIPLFAELPADDLSRLCAMIVEVRLAAGETLFNEGDMADMAYITYEGELEVTKLVDGREIRLDLHREPGIVIGESALLEESMRLATIRTEQMGKFVVVAIEDNGPGISPHNISKVFGPFFTTKPPGMGKGVGLTVAYNIVTNHHGNIEVQSEPGRTVFEVWLPVRDVS